MGPGRGPRRLEAVENTPRGGWTEPPISWAHGPPSHRELAPRGAGGGRPASGGATAAAARVGRWRGRIGAFQSLPAFRSASPAWPLGEPERPERAGALSSCPSSGSPGTCASLLGGHQPLHTSTDLSPPPSRALCSRRPAELRQFSPQGLGVWTLPSWISPS